MCKLYKVLRATLVLSLFILFGLNNGIAEESILYSAVVPNSIIRIGEVRLIENDDEVSVETVLCSSLASKAYKKIVKKELSNWPDNPDCKKYLETLKTAFSEYENVRNNKKDTVAIVISFISGINGSRVEFRFPVCDKKGKNNFIVDAVSAWKTIKLSSVYVQRNQEYILNNAFGKQADKVISKLRKLNPLEVESEK